MVLEKNILDIIDGARISIRWGGQAEPFVVGRDKLFEGVHSSKKLKVLTICTLAPGGAGMGSLRRVKALRSIGVEAKMISVIVDDEYEHLGRVEVTINGISPSEPRKAWALLTKCRLKDINKGKGFKGYEFFSITKAMNNLHALKPLIDEFDIIHLHWVVGFINYEQMHEVFGSKPIVWTTADMNPFTGGCHYSEGCINFQKDCNSCPQIDPNNSLAQLAWKEKKEAYDKLNITVVCPSSYIAEKARSSSLFADKNVHVISNSYPVNEIYFENKIIARIRLGLKLNKKYLLFGCDNVENIRKGSDLLKPLLERYITLFPDADIEVMSFGAGNVSKLNLPVPVIEFGKVAFKDLPRLYSASNVFVSLSRDDVGPMTVIESLLCGTPVVGFDIGILQEISRENDICHVTKDSFNLEGLCRGINKFLSLSKEEQIRVSILSRIFSANYAAPNVNAEKHATLYKSLLAK